MTRTSNKFKIDDISEVFNSCNEDEVIAVNLLVVGMVCQKGIDNSYDFYPSAKRGVLLS